MDENASVSARISEATKDALGDAAELTLRYVRSTLEGHPELKPRGGELDPDAIGSFEINEVRVTLMTTVSKIPVVAKKNVYGQEIEDIHEFADDLPMGQLAERIGKFVVGFIENRELRDMWREE